MIHLPSRLQVTLPKDLARIASVHLDPKKHKLFFFGSRVDGTFTERSDIDIGIDGIEIAPEDSVRSIRNEIEALPILFKIDVIDFTRANEQFREIALKNVEPIAF